MPSVSFSSVSSSRWPNSSAGTGGRCEAKAPAMRIVVLCRVAEVEDRALSAERIVLGLLARRLGLREHLEHAAA